ncbi:hypothetical protein OPT61_g492 [Boeremia exigua]|uniref:Uncharacterized protein n=1 Tax=Boeremia exigua TaxID=749465 RepID=A0ACC2ITN8_9PLEO|nr:hypothetical protein OPT61_g492 [Boeremia exigua]
MTSCSEAKPFTSTSTHTLLLPEIIFELVIYLDFHSLLRCQRVCRTWASVIARSREAQQKLFLVSDTGPFDAFKAVEERDIALQHPAAWQKPYQRIPQRAEFRALFNPWIFTQDSEPIPSGFVSETVPYYMGYWKRPTPAWRFTDRVSSGRLDFCFTPSELVSWTGATEDSCRKMFLTQPPVKRVLLSVQGGYLPDEHCDIEKDEGVRIGDILSKVKLIRGFKVMSARSGNMDFTNVDLKFDEHFTGTRFMPLQQLVKDQYGNIEARTV